jgi:hypothetical protein
MAYLAYLWVIYCLQILFLYAWSCLVAVQPHLQLMQAVVGYHRAFLLHGCHMGYLKYALEGLYEFLVAFLGTDSHSIQIFYFPCPGSLLHPKKAVKKIYIQGY